jgi:hypothetical protein
MRGVTVLLAEATRLLAIRRATLGGREGVALGELPSGVLGQSTSNIMFGIIGVLNCKSVVSFDYCF